MVCNPLYSAYFTKAKKDRLTVLDVLSNSSERTFRLNTETYDFLEVFGLSEQVARILQGFPQDQELSEGVFLGLLDAHLPKLGRQRRTRIPESSSGQALEAVGVSAYHTQLDFPVVKLLLCDDAGQFHWLTEESPRIKSGVGSRRASL